MEAATLTECPPVAREESAERTSRELQNLWFTLAARHWSALAVVPAAGADAAPRVANGLSHIGQRTAVDRPVALLDATHATVDQVARLSDELASRLARGERVVVALDPLDENPASLALASRCDAALLCVSLVDTDLKSARDAIERCGRVRFLGSVALLPNSP